MLMKVVATPAVHEGALPATCAHCEVRPGALFAGVGEAALGQVQPSIAGFDFAAGERIYLQGARGGSVFTVREGLVRFEKVTDAGDRRIVRLAGRGALIGQEAVLQRPYAEEAVACTPVRLCRIPRASLEHVQQHEPQVVRELMRRWQCALEDAEEWTSELTTGAARRRVLKLLTLLAQHSAPGEPIWLPPREEMGVMLGMATETASRIVSALRRERVLGLCGAANRARVEPQLLRAALAEQQD